IVAYDWVHKRWSGSVLLMAGCRLLLAISLASLPGHAPRRLFLAWAGALFAYIVVLSVLARREYAGDGEKARSGHTIRKLLAFIPFVDAAGLLVVQAWIPAALCALAVPGGKWAQRKAAAT